MKTSLRSLLWSRFTWRHWCSAPIESGTLVLILALGIAVFFAVRLANRAAVVNFQNFTDLLTAESDGLISAPAGSLPESVLGEIRGVLGGEPVHLIPVLETTGALPRTNEIERIGERETYQIVGVDLIALQNLAAQRHANRPWFNQTNRLQSESPTPSASDRDAFWKTFRDPQSAYISQSLALLNQVQPGQSLPMIVNDHVVDLRVAGIIPAPPDHPNPPANLIVMDLPALQMLTDRTGRLDRIEFVLDPGYERAARWAKIRSQLESAAAGRWVVGTPADRRAAGEQMTRAFRLNLTILSLLALVVGLYLVFQALDGAVVRRREEIAILRSLGVPASEIRAAWLLEASVLGIVGGLLGLGLGWLGAQGAVRLIGRTINALYYATSAKAAALSAAEAIFALLLAVATSLLAGWLPARTAANTPPAQILVRSGTTFGGPAWLRLPGWGLIALIAGLALTPLPPWRMQGGARLPWASYLAAILWLAGAGMIAGSVLKSFARALKKLGTRRPTWRLALSQLSAPSGRHRLALAGLVAAVAMTAGMAILVSSFDTTMRGWIERTFQADLYISSDGAQSASTQNRIRPEIWRSIAQHPAVAVANAVQVAEVKLPNGSTLLAGGELAWFRDRIHTAWVVRPADEAIFDPARNATLCLVSEAFCARFQVGIGDTLEVPTPRGPQRLQIAGVFADYGNERGSISVERRHFASWFGDELASSLILKLKPGQNPETMRAELRTAHPGLAVFTNSYLRQEALRIFQQTFAITYALELIGVVVAVAGLGFTMMSLLLERRSELTTLRALGFTHREIAASTAWESILTAFAGVATGLVLSLGLGWLLIARVNRQTFGWTLETDRPWGQLATLAALVIAAGAIVGWAVGRRGAQLPAEQEE